jgi:hypothetical protein
VQAFKCLLVFTDDHGPTVNGIFYESAACCSDPALIRRKIPLTVRYLILRKVSAPIIYRKHPSEAFSSLQGEQEKDAT